MLSLAFPRSKPELRNMLRLAAISDNHIGLSRAIYSEARRFLAKGKAEILLSAPQASASRFLLKAAIRAVVLASKDVLQIVQSHKRSLQLHNALIAEIDMMNCDEPRVDSCLTAQQVAGMQQIFRDLDLLGRQSLKEDAVEVCAGMKDLGEFFASLRASLQAELDSCSELSSRLARNMQMARNRISRMERNMTNICREVQNQFSSATSGTRAVALAEVCPPTLGNSVASPELPNEIHDCVQEVCSLSSHAPCSVEEIWGPLRFGANDAELVKEPPLPDEGMAPLHSGAEIANLERIRRPRKMWAISRGVAGLLWVFKQTSCCASPRRPSCVLPPPKEFKSNSPTSSKNSRGGSIMPASTRLPVIPPELHRPDQVATPRSGRKLAQSKTAAKCHGSLPNSCRLPSLSRRSPYVQQVGGRSAASSMAHEVLHQEGIHDASNSHLESCSSSSKDEPTDACGSRCNIMSKESAEEDILRLLDSDDCSVCESHDAHADRRTFTRRRATLQEPGMLHGQDDAGVEPGICTEAGSCRYPESCHHEASLDFEVSVSSHHFRQASEHLKRRRAGRLPQLICEPPSPTMDLQGQQQLSSCKHQRYRRRWHVLSPSPEDTLELTAALACESLFPSQACLPDMKATQPGDDHFPLQPRLPESVSPAHAHGAASPPRKMSRLATQHMQKSLGLVAGA